MGLIKITLDHERLTTLESQGIRLPTLRGTRDFDDRSTFEPPFSLQATVATPTMVQIGAFSSISGGKLDGVIIGRYCAIAPDVVIGAHEHPTGWLTVSRVAYYPIVYGWDQFCRPDAVDFIRTAGHHFSSSRPITTIGHDVWIGQGAFIKSGVTLGTGCIVAARAVVTKDVPPYAIVMGTPAKITRYRFPEPLIDRLLQLAWWRYSLYDCFQVPFEHIEEAVEQIGHLVTSGALKPYAPPILRPHDLTNVDCNDAPCLPQAGASS